MHCIHSFKMKPTIPDERGRRHGFRISACVGRAQPRKLRYYRSSMRKFVHLRRLQRHRPGNFPTSGPSSLILDLHCVPWG